MNMDPSFNTFLDGNIDDILVFSKDGFIDFLFQNLETKPEYSIFYDKLQTSNLIFKWLKENKTPLYNRKYRYIYEYPLYCHHNYVDEYVTLNGDFIIDSDGNAILYKLESKCRYKKYGLSLDIFEMQITKFCDIYKIKKIIIPQNNDEWEKINLFLGFFVDKKKLKKQKYEELINRMVKI